jgi:hypothetical protein
MDKTKTIAWGPLYEKAWCKVRGTMDLCDGGFFETGVRMLTNSPVESFKTNDTVTNTTQAETFWNLVKSSLAAGYLIATGTDGSSNTQTNSCGIA